MVDLYREISPQLEGSVLVFNGDADPCVSYEGTREAVRRVGFEQLQPYRPWFFNATAAPAALLANKDILFGPGLSFAHAGPQLGGYVADYAHGLSFATVHGAGHMVPQTKPREALQLIRTVLSDRLLAPDLPSSEVLAGMSEGGFKGFANEWVTRATSAPFVGADGHGGQAGSES